MPRKLRLAFLLNLRNFKIRLYKLTKVFSQSSSCQKLFICLFYICQVSFHSQCPLAYSVFVAFYFYYFYFCSILSYYCALRQRVFPIKQVITGFFFSSFFNSLNKKKHSKVKNVWIKVAFILYKLTKNSALNKRKVAFFCRSFLSVFVLYLFQGIFSTRLAQNLLIRKTLFKKCLHFVTFYKADALYRFEFVFYFFLWYTCVLCWDTFSRNSKYAQCIKIKTFKFHIDITEMTNNQQQTFGT